MYAAKLYVFPITATKWSTTYNYIYFAVFLNIVGTDYVECWCYLVNEIGYGFLNIFAADCAKFPMAY